MKVAALGYLGFTTAGPLDEWARFATDVLGAAVTLDADRLRLRLDERNFRIEVVRAQKPGVRFIGWDVGTDDALVQLTQRLQQSGVACVPASDSVCRDRGVIAMTRCVDPAGNQLELFYGQMCPKAPFISPQGVQFVSGELGLGHVVFRVDRYEETLRFYRELLGFRLTDVWTGKEGSAVFMHCNARHHSLALRGGGTAEPELIHFMLEVDQLDAVGLATERGADRITRTLGRHFNDRMISCYFKTPSEFEVEYGTGGRMVDDATWVVEQIDSPSGWGHRRIG